MRVIHISHYCDTTINQRGCYGNTMVQLQFMLLQKEKTAYQPFKNFRK